MAGSSALDLSVCEHHRSTKRSTPFRSGTAASTSSACRERITGCDLAVALENLKLERRSNLLTRFSAYWRTRCRGS